MRRGFTLLELIVVIIILGVLATLGFTQYTKMVEKGRTAEAKMVLGQIRTAEIGYMQEYGNTAANVTLLPVDVPLNCSNTHYYNYSVSGNIATAARCTSGGKVPNSTILYNITLNFTNGSGIWGGDAGYY